MQKTGKVEKFELYTYYSVLYGGFENEKKKGKKNLTFRCGDFWTIFPVLISIFREGEGDEIKSSQPSKRDWTLSTYANKPGRNQMYQR